MYNYIPAKRKQYSEENQPKSIKYSFGNIDPETNTFNEWFAPVKCRDFLLDTLYSKETKESLELYGFNFDYSTVKETETQLEMVIRTKKVNIDAILANLPTLHEIEIKHNLQPTAIYPTDKSDVFVVIGDKFWKSTTPLLGLYTWMFRLFLYTPLTTLDDLAKFKSNADEIWKFQTIYPKLKEMLDNLKTFTVPYEEEWKKYCLKETYNWHFTSGIRGYLTFRK